MKKIIIALSLLAFAFQSCNKEKIATEGFDFSNVLPSYVELASTSTKTVKQGANTSVTFQMRTALQETVTITYNVTGGVNLLNQTAVIPRNELSVGAPIAIPAGVIVAPATSTSATLTVVKAVTASGKVLTLGQKNTPATQKVTINIVL